MKAEIYNALVWLNRPSIRIAIIAIVLFLVTFKVSALELVVVDDPECYYCQQFRQGAGQTYDMSEYGEWAPLVSITYAIGYRPDRNLWSDWFRDAMDDGRIRKITGTPTFILYDLVPGEEEPREIGRIVGYGGEESFYENMKHYKEQYPAWKAQFSN